MPVWGYPAALAALTFFATGKLSPRTPRGVALVLAVAVGLGSAALGLDGRGKPYWTAWTINKKVRPALNRFLIDHQKPPSTTDQLRAILPVDEAYDEWGRPFVYEKGDKRNVWIRSLGRDGSANTADDLVCHFLANPAFDETEDCYACGWYLPAPGKVGSAFRFSNAYVFWLFDGALGLILLSIYRLRGKEARFSRLVLFLGVLVILQISCQMLDNIKNRGELAMPDNCYHVAGARKR